MKAALLKLIILFGIFSYSTLGSAQYYNQERSKLGFLLETNFSNLRYHGLTPSLTIGNVCHTFQFGPRINFNFFLGDKSPRQNFVLDMGYKVVFFNKLKWLELYGIFRMEYGYNKKVGRFDYQQPQEEHPGVLDLGEGDFTVKTSSKLHTFNAHIGGGSIFNFTNNIYLKTEAALGVGMVSELTNYSKQSDGSSLSDRRRFYGLQELSWFVSSGIGYRF